MSRENQSQFCLWLPTKLLKKIREVAAQQNRDTTKQIVFILRQYLGEKNER